jgi:hypothetical protein
MSKRSQKQRRKPERWTMKDGLLVPSKDSATYDAASKEGEQALQDMLAKHEIPKVVQLAGYDGNERKEFGGPHVIKLRTKAICWGFPFDELTYSKWVINLLGLRLMPWDDFFTAHSTYLPDARNIVHSHFVKDSKCEWLMMVDTDVLVPPDIIDRLMAHDKKMVGGWYRMKADPYSPVVYDMHDNLFDDKGVPLYAQRTEPGEGLESVDGAGAGVWLMHREIAEALGPKPYHMEEGGEDLLLCRKVHELGYETWIDWGCACAHCGVAYV